MKEIFRGAAFLQVALYITIVYGVSKGILKKDLYVNIVKISSIIIFLLSLYMVNNIKY